MVLAMESDINDENYEHPVAMQRAISRASRNMKISPWLTAVWRSRPWGRGHSMGRTSDVYLRGTLKTEKDMRAIPWHGRILTGIGQSCSL